MKKGSYKLYIPFQGEITSRMNGFYRNKYTSPDGSETRYGASTQFEVGVYIRNENCLSC